MPFADVKESWCIPVIEEIADFCKKLDEKIDKGQQQIKERRKKNELESKMAQELKLNSELTQQLEEISRRGSELERVCASFESSLTIADSDRNRLDNAKEIYQIAKEVTGIHFDFTAPSDLSKGYIKSESRHLLQPFEHRADPDVLWQQLGAATAAAWPRLPHDKENRTRNK